MKAALKGHDGICAILCACGDAFGGNTDSEIMSSQLDNQIGLAGFAENIRCDASFLKNPVQAFRSAEAGEGMMMGESLKSRTERLFLDASGLRRDTITE